MKITKILMSMALLSISSIGLASYRKTATKLTPAALSAMNSGTAQTVTPGIVRTGVINTNPQFVPMAVNSQPYSTKSNITGPSISNQSSSTSNSSLYSWLLAGLATLGFAKNDEIKNDSESFSMNQTSLQYDVELKEINNVYLDLLKSRPYSKCTSDVQYFMETLTELKDSKDYYRDEHIKLLESMATSMATSKKLQRHEINYDNFLSKKRKEIDKEYADLIDEFADKYVECKKLSSFGRIMK